MHFCLFTSRRVCATMAQSCQCQQWAPPLHCYHRQFKKGGYGRSLFCEMCYPHRTPNSFFLALQSSCKGFGWIWIQRPRFPALPIPQIKGSGLLLPCSTCPLITKDTACPHITIASRNWHHLMPGICTSSGGPSTHPSPP